MFKLPLPLSEDLPMEIYIATMESIINDIYSTANKSLVEKFDFGYAYLPTHKLITLPITANLKHGGPPTREFILIKCNADKNETLKAAIVDSKCTSLDKILDTIDSIDFNVTLDSTSSKMLTDDVKFKLEDDKYYYYSIEYGDFLAATMKLLGSQIHDTTELHQYHGYVKSLINNKPCPLYAGESSLPDFDEFLNAVINLTEYCRVKAIKNESKYIDYPYYEFKINFKPKERT